MREPEERSKLPIPFNRKGLGRKRNKKKLKKYGIIFHLSLRNHDFFKKCKFEYFYIGYNKSNVKGKRKHDEYYIKTYRRFFHIDIYLPKQFQYRNSNTTAVLCQYPDKMFPLLANTL